MSSNLKIGKLNFWREAITESFKGNSQREPLSLVLSESIKKFEIPEKPFHMFLDAIETEI